MQKIISKDEKFCIELFKHKSYLKRHAKRFFNLQEDDAEDIIQNVFIKAMRYSNNENSSIKSLLVKIMKNEVINDSRKISNRIQKIDIDHCNHHYVQDYDFILCVRINKKISELDKKLSQPFMLFCDGYTYDEIAKKLNIEMHAVKSCIYRCRETLKNFIMKEPIKKLVNVSDSKTVIVIKKIREDKKNRKKTIIKNVSH